LVREDWSRRLVGQIGQKLINWGGRPVEGIAESAVIDLQQILARNCPGHNAFSFNHVDVAELLEMVLPERACLLGGWLHHQDLAMVHAWRGVGKTFFALGVAVAVAAGKPFLAWEAGDRPAGVLYIDGEMPAKAIRDRLKMMVHAVGLPQAPLELVTPDLQRQGMRNLNDPLAQKAIERILDSDNTIKLIILDNLSALCGGPENDAESWQGMQDFLLRLRRRGIAVLVVHHSGKCGAQRGTSRREDVLDTVIHLTLPGDHEQNEGARFDVTFEKSRGVFGDAVESIEASLIEDEAGSPVWATKTLQDSRMEQVARLIAEGVPQKDIAIELGINKSNVSRAVKRAREHGLLDGHGRR